MSESVTTESAKQIEGIMRTTIENLKSVIDVNSIVGKPIRVYDDNIVVPISKVSFGFVGGGSEFISDKAKQSPNSIGGSGAGVSITPIGFLVCGNKNTFIKVDETVENDKWASLIKSAISLVKE